MKINYSKKILIISIVTFVMVIVLNIIFTNLLLNKINDINNKVKQLETSSQEREKALSLKDSVLSSVTEREELLKYFVGSGNAETVKFTKFLEDLALGMNLTQKKTLEYESVSGVGGSEVVSIIRFRFVVSGKWLNVYNFLQAIENLPKVASLNSTSLNYNSLEKNWSADLDFSVAKLK